MVPELSELTYEDRLKLKEMGLPTLQNRKERERGDLITLYKIVNGIEKLDEQNLEMEEETRQMRGHSNQKKSVSKGHKKVVFHIELWTPGMD